MEFRNIRALRGPNVWARCTALEVAVDLGEMKFPVREIPGFQMRLRDWLPGHSTAPGDKPESLAGSQTLAHVLERAVMALQALAGAPSSFSRTASTDPGVYKVVVEYQEEEVGRSAVETARSLIEAAIHDRPFDLAAS